ncbi:YjgN family protein [Methylosinus sporium]|uniref:DUF898 domain-containing protein n=1 Tax=Methylosinus sporium TaxID=428 RepID=A0A2U1STC0_METSR|nr:DUF898 family protein [Methylosinus sporium]PWB94832.1 DUF898 domain-containing protein [Methylosinus sporium]
MSDVLLAAEVSAADKPTPILFTGDNGEFRRLVTRGALLELVTAGFYRFWLATHMRRYLWSSTVIGGDALEYVGTARELLFGFFFALVILAPVYIAYLVVGLEAERAKAFASLPLGLFFAAFGQFAIYRARRYRLNRSSWRGLRFGMSGSGLGYMLRALGWGALIAVTLGLALPWAEAALERYKMRNTYYGALEGDFVGRGGDFFKRAGWIWFTALILLLSPYVIGAVFRGPIWILAGVIYVFGAPSLFAAFKAEQWRWWLRGLRLGGVRLETNLTMTALLGNYFVFLGVTIGVLIAAAIVFGIVVAMNRNAMVGTTPPIGVLIPIGLAYVATFLSIGVALRIFLMQRVWKLVASSVVVHGLAEAEDVATRASVAPSAIGEGFADSLDVVGF